MITFLYAIVLVALGVAPLVLLWYADRKHKTRANRRLLQYFEQEGASNALHINNRELLPQAIVGVDEIRRKLLLAWKEEEGFFRSRLVDLDKLKGCLVLEDSWVDTGDSILASPKSLEVDRLVLQVEAYNWPTVDIPFFDVSLQNRNQLPQMRQKAGKWQAIITGLAGKSPLLATGNLAKSG